MANVQAHMQHYPSFRAISGEEAWKGFSEGIAGAIARNMVAAGCGISIIDPINGRIDLRDGVIWRPFAPRIVHESVMITSRDHARGQGTAEMQDSIRSHVAPFLIEADRHTS